MTNFRLCVALLATVFIAPVSQLRASIIFSNVSGSIPEGSGGFSGTACGECTFGFALEFTPSADYVFTSALIDLFLVTGLGDGNLVAGLYSSNPGTGDGCCNIVAQNLLAQLDYTPAIPTFSGVPQLTFGENATTFTQASGPPVVLTTGTEYWVGLTPGDANTGVDVAYGAATSDVPFADESGSIGPPGSRSAPKTTSLRLRARLAHRSR